MKRTVDLEEFLVRLPNGMRDAIRARAQEKGRSMNGQIVLMLNAALDELEKPPINIEAEAEYAARKALKILNHPNFDPVVVDLKEGRGSAHLRVRWPVAYDSAKFALEKWVPQWRRKKY